MARLTRVRQKVFASNASNNGVFGSLQAGNPQTSNDVATLQSLSAFENGWDDAIEQGDKLPPLEEFQGIQYGISYQQAYMLQEGIAEWDANTTYYKGGLVKTISGTSFKLYCSLADNNTNKAVTNTSYWKKVMDSDDLYAYDSAVVHLAGAETITGSKTFSGLETFTSGVYRQGTWTAGTTPSSNIENAFSFVDSTGTVYGSVNKYYSTGGVFQTRLSAKKTDGTGEIHLSIGYDGNGNARALAPTPDTTTATNSTQIGTTGWVNSVGNNVLHLNGTETVTTSKTFMATQYVGESSITKGTAPASNTYYGLYFVDKNGTSWSNNQLGQIQMQCSANGDNSININAIQQTAGSTNGAGIKVAIKQNGDTYTSAPVPSTTTSTSDTNIATTGWVNSTGNNIVHLDGTETITGSKTFSDSVNASWNITQGTAPDSNSYRTVLNVLDANGKSVARFQPSYYTDGIMRSAIQVIRPMAGSTAVATLAVFYSPDGSSWAEAPTPSNASENNTNKIITTSWVKNSVDGGYISGIPDYGSRTEFTTSSYTPTKNGIIRVMAQGSKAMAEIKLGNFLIARSESTDGEPSLEAVWAIVKKGETYTVGYNGSTAHAFYFIPFA